MYDDFKGHSLDLDTIHLRDTGRISRPIWGVCVACCLADLASTRRFLNPVNIEV